MLDFLNTLNVEEGTDALDEVSDLEEWSRQHGEPPGRLTKRDWEAARQLRDTLRAAAGAVTASDRLDASVPVTVRVTSGGSVSLSGRTPAELVAAAVAELALRGDSNRLKICQADDCQWAFYDSSRNQSRQWCSMAVCGNRAKVRAHRSRVS